MSRVPNTERLRIVELCQKQYTQRQIAEMTGRSNKTVNRIIQAYRDEGRISDAPHKRHPRATSAAQDVAIRDAAKASPFSTAKEIGAAAGVSASVSTIKRRLEERKLKSHVAAQKPRLSVSNKTARLNFATEHASWTMDDWKTVLFSDESTFTTRWEQKQRVWRPVNARYDPLYVQEV
ncbi:hypothetical protein HPB48_003998 [Haemaphysalis longicornis]|uniref:Transposase Tc1-like domain-containing protein n=1 Tax=Haemaphysalis longicornis TaxID=44386 RepID=A0A9J6GV84_HAELO|nr:hypothetical protein HPB48_003998 [Haemaphysalis longicornis]